MCSIWGRGLSSAKIHNRSEYSAFWLNSMLQITVKKLSYGYRLTITLQLFCMSLHLLAEKRLCLCSVLKFPTTFHILSKLHNTILQLWYVLEAPWWLQGSAWIQWEFQKSVPFVIENKMKRVSQVSETGSFSSWWCSSWKAIFQCIQKPTGLGFAVSLRSAGRICLELFSF